MNRDKQIERALRRLLRYIAENRVCDVYYHADDAACFSEQSGHFITLLDQASDALHKDTSDNSACSKLQLTEGSND